MFFTNWHSQVIKRLLFLLIPYSLLRIGFYFYHLDIYRRFTQDEIFNSFLLGIRFDLAAICLVNLPIILLSLIPSKKLKYLKYDHVLFVVVNVLGFILALDDYELFHFMGKRLSFDLFSLGGDILQQLPQIAMYYWYFPLTALLMGIALSYIDRKLFQLRPEKRPALLHILSYLFLLGITFIGIRGGLQRKSINIQSAFVQGKNELGHLVLNTPYHFLRGLKNQRVERISFFANDDIAKSIILNQRDQKASFPNPAKLNVVLIILESFSLEYMEQGYTPFLEELKKKSLFLNKHLANGRRSIEVLPAMFCGLPALIDDPISKSVFAGNRFNCLPEYLKQVGYTSHFFHGGSRGTMGFDSYTLSLGFDRYFSREDYPGNDYDGSWGVFDGPYLKYVAAQISKMPTPFMAGIFTLSSHQPYSVPESLVGKFSQGTLEIHASIGYVDYALRNFFESIKHTSWYEQTIFIITADHTQKHASNKFLNLVGHYRVPMIIHAPGLKLPLVNKVTQHSDIPSTVLDMLGVKNAELPLMGASIFSQDPGMGINYADAGTYLLASGHNVYTVTKSGEAQVSHIDWESGTISRPEENEAILLKALLQYYINGLIDNNLSL